MWRSQKSIRDALGRIERKIDGLTAALARIQQEEAKMTGELQQLTDDIAAETTVEQSAITLLQGLAAQLKAAAEDPAQVKALASQIEQNTAALSAAITANTPPPPA